MRNNYIRYFTVDWRKVLERDSKFELLRIISMFLIVLCHITLVPTIFNSVGANVNFVIAHLQTASALENLAIFGRAGNELFVLISGYFLIEKKPKISRFFRTMNLVHMYSWSFLIISLILSLFFTIHINLSEIFHQIFPVIFSQYWFVTVYLVIILLSPFLNTLIKNLNMKQNFTLFGILISVILFFPTLMLRANNNVGFHDIGVFITLYYGAALLRLYPQKLNFKKKWLVASFLTGWLIQLFVICTFNYLGVTYRKDVLILKANYFNSQESIFLFLMCYSLFILIVFAKDFKNRLINRFAVVSFDVYLIHANIFVFPILFKNNYIISIYNSKGVIYSVTVAVLMAIVIHLLSSVMAMIIRKLQNIIGTPKIRITYTRIRKLLKLLYIDTLKNININ